MTSTRIPVFFIGCVQSSEVALKTLLARHTIEVVGVLTLRVSKFNADFVDIATVATQAGVPVYDAEETDAHALATILRENGSEIVFTIGWSRLVGVDILDIPRFGFVGFHPAALPQNRGRHPLIWALALGLEQTASTLFMMDEGVDSGPIVSQQPILITSQEDAQSLYDKVLALLPGQINSLVDQLEAGELRAVPQQIEQATVWRKRGAPDGLIDWRMSAAAIYNLTRALTRPYIGAEFRHAQALPKLWRCEIFTGNVPRNAEPGKVLKVDARGPVIKTGMGADGGALRLLETENCPELQKGDYL
jgi:methionyl-tRNA formyltransferase